MLSTKQRRARARRNAHVADMKFVLEHPVTASTRLGHSRFLQICKDLRIGKDGVKKIVDAAVEYARRQRDMALLAPSRRTTRRQNPLALAVLLASSALSSAVKKS